MTEIVCYIYLYARYTISTSPNLCHRTTLLNIDVPNCYITLEFITIRLRVRHLVTTSCCAEENLAGSINHGWGFCPMAPYPVQPLRLKPVELCVQKFWKFCTRLLLILHAIFTNSMRCFGRSTTPYYVWLACIRSKWAQIRVSFRCFE